MLTGDDYTADGIGSLPSIAAYRHRTGKPMVVPFRPAVAVGRVRVVGQPVAVVVARTPEQARDATELVDVDYAGLPAVVSA